MCKNLYFYGKHDYISTLQHSCLSLIVKLLLNAVGWEVSQQGKDSVETAVAELQAWMHEGQPDCHVDRGPPVKKNPKKLPSICQLSSCGNIFKWILFILFDSLSEPGTMRREQGQWRHSGLLLRVRRVQMYN